MGNRTSVLSYFACRKKCKGRESSKVRDWKRSANGHGHHPFKTEGCHRERSREGSSHYVPAEGSTEEPPTLAPKKSLWVGMVTVRCDPGLIPGSPGLPCNQMTVLPPIHRELAAWRQKTKQGRNSFRWLHGDSPDYPLQGQNTVLGPILQLVLDTKAPREHMGLKPKLCLSCGLCLLRERENSCPSPTKPNMDGAVTSAQRGDHYWYCTSLLHGLTAALCVSLFSRQRSGGKLCKEMQ